MTSKETIEVLAGTKNQLTMKVEGTQVKMPMTVITGSAEGPRVLVTTGVHGAEYPGTLAMIELARDLHPEDIHGRLMAIHPVNTQAFQARMAFILPEDGCNINRVFPGQAHGSSSERVAWWLNEFFDASDFYLDLHSGDLYEELTPFVYYSELGDEKVQEISRAAAGFLELPWLLKSSSSNGTIGTAARKGIPGLLIERGGAGCCSRQEVDLYKKDVLNIFKHLGLLVGEPEIIASPPVEISEVIYLQSELNGVWVSEIRAGQKVTKGQLLGRICDYFGNELKSYQAQRAGVVFYRLNGLSANSGDTLVAY